MKQSERRWEQSREELTRKGQDLSECQRDLAEVNEQLDSLRLKFRDKMENLLGGGKVINETKLEACLCLYQRVCSWRSAADATEQTGVPLFARTFVAASNLPPESRSQGPSASSYFVAIMLHRNDNVSCHRFGQ